MNTSRFSFLLLLILNVHLHAANDSLFNPGLMIGVDVSGFARNYLSPETMAWEVSADKEWRRNWFAAVEAGGLSINILKESHTYKAGGYFVRMGINYNLIDRSDMENVGMVYGLTRYGYGRINHEAPDITIGNHYWGNTQTAIPSERAHAHWFEMGGGLKARLIGNVFIGWTIRTRFLIYLSETSGMEPYTISGFGKNQGRPSVMVHYHIYYRF